MDQRSDDIRQDIESTRASLDEKLDSLEVKARQAFDIKHQVSEKPWMMFGAAMAAGFALGSLGGGEDEQRWQGQPYTTTDYNQHAGSPGMSAGNHQQSSSSLGGAASSFLSQFDDEIDMLKVAAVNMLTSFLRDTVREYIPALGQQLDKQAGQPGQPNPPSQSSQFSRPTGTVSTAPGASRRADFESGASSVNSESIPTTTSYGSNMADQGAEHADPYYPPGSTGARERSVGEKTTY